MQLSTVAAYLADHQVMALAVQDHEGAWSAPVYYAVLDGDKLIFLSRLDSRHGQALLHHSQAAFSIYSDACQWTEIRGLQGEGQVRLLQGDARDRAKRGYLERFAFIAQDPQLLQSMNKVSWFELEISTLLWLDNQNGLGQRVAIDVKSERFKQVWNARV
ncbi:MAG: pyridoxamine 5'-phosphate oxidase family protein [Plesiomonas shigelloides]|uniref:pyridoxamine 5'-phosphate oxidase family protein n=1 Tax=Plesiomonas shigelloides TaxID=703 RepID=UPI001261724F|nr:pyridoxamine 5'-phosphate oxidase family protein [Plesiomonas shigelloides]KAB7677683.1 hypothetical protein GBN16_06540 [Plesiomonas shigelloides]